VTKSNPLSVTINDVAKQAGVSTATVSRYINETVPVSKEVSVRIQATIDELKFVPHVTARRLAICEMNTLGMLVDNMCGDFFGPMLSGIESVSSENGFDLLVSSSHSHDTRKRMSIGPPNTDGLLVFANSLDDESLSRFHNLGFPMVLIYQSSPKGMEIPCVVVENKNSSRQIVEHLIDVHGRRRIVFLNGPQNNEDSHWREVGYRKALEAHRIPYDPDLTALGEYDRNIAKASIRDLLKRDVDFDAVFSGDDEAAVGVLDALSEAGKRVPEEVSVVGFDNQQLSTFTSPPLTTVDVPIEEVGRIAARQLIKLVRTGEAESLVLFPTEIIIRHSCGC